VVRQYAVVIAPSCGRAPIGDHLSQNLFVVRSYVHRPLSSKKDGNLPPHHSSFIIAIDLRLDTLTMCDIVQTPRSAWHIIPFDIRYVISGLISHL
jgi:hypothetical protein